MQTISREYHAGVRASNHPDRWVRRLGVGFSMRVKYMAAQMLMICREDSPAAKMQWAWSWPGHEKAMAATPIFFCFKTIVLLPFGLKLFGL